MNFIGTGTRLIARDYASTAATVGILVATLQGVVDVEAAGSGFDSKNRPKILPEPHVFFRRLGPGPSRDRAVKLGVAYVKWGAKPYPKTSEANYQRLALMMSVDEKKALESTSWGLTQIMGYNCKDAGYSDVQAFVEAFKTGEAEQLAAFVRLIDKWDLEDELVRRDARGFALKYNGKGFEKNHYDTKLLTAWSRRDAAFTSRVTQIDAVPTDTRGPVPQVDPPAPAVATPSHPVLEALPEEQTSSTIIQVQTRLKEIGYHEVGTVDGGANGMYRTQIAIAAFRMDAGLPLTDKNDRPLGIDAGLLVALQTATPRAISEWRAGVTPADLRPTSPSMTAAFRQKVIAFLGMAGAGTVTAVNGVLDNFTAARAKLTPLTDTFSVVPGWTWGVMALALAFSIWRLSRAVERSGVAKFQSGEHL